jgi:hypothetical protein
VTDRDKVEKKKARIVDLFVRLEDLSDEEVNLICVGDKEVDGHGKTIAEILKRNEPEQYSVEIKLGSGNFTQGFDVARKQVFTKMRILCEVDEDKQIYFKNSILKKDVPFEFITDKYRVKCSISNIYRNEKWLKVKILFSNLAPNTCSVIAKNDVANDAEGKVFGIIEEILNIKPSNVFIMQNESFIEVKHLMNKDIVAVLSLKCQENGNIFYYNNNIVKIGNNIMFSTNAYSILGEIIGFDNDDKE